MRPVIIYARETKVLKGKLLIAERKILRRIFGPTQDRDGTWRLKTNDELNNLIRKENIIIYIKAQRLYWFGRLHRIKNERVVKKLYNWKPIRTILAGRTKIRWNNDIKEDLRCMNINNWTKYIQDRVNWKDVAEKAKTFEQ